MTPRASACAKIILLGEHAVVYGFPAVAVPVRSLRATAEYDAGPPPLRIEAPDIGLRAVLEDLPAENPLGFCVRHTLDVLHIPLSGGRLRVTSDIPVASGMGSGASVSTAVVRALAAAAGKTVDAEQVSAIVYEVERIHHGTPSGVDNTVIAYEQPVYFVRGKDPDILAAGGSMLFLIADSGVRSATRDAVAGVRERRNKDPERYDGIFQSIGELTDAGRACLEAGDRRMLGRAMFESQGLLDAIGVGAPGLTRLVDAARNAGAWGAKLSGAGLGGNVIALVKPESAEPAEAALRAAGAAAVFRTVLEHGNHPPPQTKSPHGT
ncbi:MAG: mevalonate kinase [Anaerolineales bacterium]